MNDIPLDRFILPALLAVLTIGLVVVLVAGGGGGGDASSDPRPPAVSRGSDANSSSASRTPKSMTVREGDTPTSIADRAGITVEYLTELNPTLDPRTLRPGQKLKLAR